MLGTRIRHAVILSQSFTIAAQLQLHVLYFCELILRKIIVVITKMKNLTA